MDSKEIKTFTWDDALSFTWDQLLMDKFELLKNAASGELSLPDTTWKTLCNLCRQTIDDFNRICPDNGLEIPECIYSPSTTRMNPERIMRIITFIMSVITFFRGILCPPTETTNITINNFNISIEDKGQLYNDINEVIKYLSEQKDV